MVVLAIESASLLDEQRWFRVFGDVELVDARGFGAIQERRLRRPDGLEIEVGIGDVAWAVVDPPDAGTAEVVRGGFLALFDPDGLLARLLDVVQAPGSAASGDGSGAVSR